MIGVRGLWQAAWWIRERPAVWTTVAAAGVALVLAAAVVIVSPVDFSRPAASPLIFAALAGIASRQALERWAADRDPTYRLARAIRGDLRLQATWDDIISALWVGSVWVPLSDPPPADPGRWFRWRAAMGETRWSFAASLGPDGPELPIFLRHSDAARHRVEFAIHMPAIGLVASVADSDPPLRVTLVDGERGLRLEPRLLEAIAAADRALSPDRPRSETQHAAAEFVREALTPLAES